ncbi:MAG TPA: TonB-dependent receptor, partial [Phenylobacterium sp.]|nr:TonB-dependent receptor [Phenylobacterium sp.]
VVTDSYGVFGQVVWTPAGLQDLHLTLGGRLTKDQKKGSLDTVNGALPSYVNASKQVIVGRVPLDESWSRFDPLVTVAYDVTPDVNLYGRWSTGYKSGG